MAEGGFLSHIEALRKAVLEILAIFVILLIPGWIFAPDLFAMLQAAAARIAEQHGGKGFVSSDELPELRKRYNDGDVGYHLRPGRHYLSREDWQRYIEFLSQK